MTKKEGNCLYKTLVSAISAHFVCGQHCYQIQTVLWGLLPFSNKLKPFFFPFFGTSILDLGNVHRGGTRTPRGQKSTISPSPRSVNPIR